MGYKLPCKKALSRKIGLVGIAILAIAIIFSAILFTQPTQPKVKSSVVYAYVSDFPTLDPSIAFEDEQVILANVYEALIFYNSSNPSSPLTPWLATSWNYSQDGLVWTFNLRKNILFHDGTPFNAEAVKFSVERTKRMGLGAAYIWDPVKEIQVVDDYTIKFILQYPAPLAQIASSQYGAWIFSPKIPSNDTDATEWFNQGKDAGTGAFTIESYEAGFQIVLKRFDKYWRGWSGNHIEKVLIKTVRDPTARLQAIKAGEADFTVDLPVDYLPELKDNPNVKVLAVPSYRNLLGMINTKRAPTDNVLVRQALAYAFPYDAVVKNVMQNYAAQSKGPIPIGMIGYFEDMPHYTYNLTKAKELLEKAGYPNGGFTIILTYTSGDQLEKQVAELYKAELEKLGITLDIREMTTKAKYSLARGDPKEAQHILLFYWWPTYITPYDFLYSLFHSEEKVIFNFAYYYNSTYDNLIDTASRLEGTDLNKALQLYRKAQEQVIRDCTALFIIDMDTIMVVNSKVHNFKPNSAYTEVVFFYDIWVES
ncbi:MAG: ABC transporter substrate-binding protein [Nitrososphaeria archaeon]